jgi:hypothetical protein
MEKERLPAIRAPFFTFFGSWKKKNPLYCAGFDTVLKAHRGVHRQCPHPLAFIVGLVGLLISFAMLMVLPAVAGNKKNSDGPWKRYKNENGIIGYERSVQRSKYLETRAETVIDAPMEVLLEVLKDIPAYPQWMHKCKEAIPLGQEGELKKVLYFAQGVPWGSPDRDAVIEAITVEDFDKGTCVTILHSIENHPFQRPQKKNGRKRQWMIEFSGVWDLRLIDRNRTKVIYTAYTNPGGFAPKLIVDGVIRKVSFRSLKGMIPMAKEQKYMKAAAKGDIKKRIDAAVKKN